MNTTVNANSLKAMEANLTNLATSIQDIGNRVLNLSTDEALDTDLFGISAICHCLGEMARGNASDIETWRNRLNATA